MIYKESPRLRFCVAESRMTRLPFGDGDDANRIIRDSLFVGEDRPMRGGETSSTSARILEGVRGGGILIGAGGYARDVAAAAVGDSADSVVICWHSADHAKIGVDGGDSGRADKRIIALSLSSERSVEEEEEDLLMATSDVITDIDDCACGCSGRVSSWAFDIRASNCATRAEISKYLELQKNRERTEDLSLVSAHC